MNENVTTIITIDGPAGTGKSTVARQLARALGFDFLDTGAMYRAAALLAIENGIDPTDGPAIAEAMLAACIAFDWTTDPPCLQMNHPKVRDISGEIRSAAVTQAVSPVSACPEVRRVLVEEQQRLGREHPQLVTEGRDQGSVVFPDAAVRFYLDASPVVRAKRRADQLRATGQTVDENAIRESIIQRDDADRARAVGPLTIPCGAIMVDSSELSRDDVVAQLVRLVNKHGGIPGSEDS